MACKYLAILVLLAFALVDLCSTETIKIHAGKDVTLSCPLDLQSCGKLHSVKWYRGENNRIAVYSNDLTVKKVEGQQSDRMTILHTTDAETTSLLLKSVSVTDEDEYTCENTFLDPQDTCDSVTIIKLEILVPPSKVVLTDEANITLADNSKLGPLREGAKLVLYCEAFNARPVPVITWKKGGQEVKGISNFQEQDGLYSTRSELSISLSRRDLKAKIECNVHAEALDEDEVETVTLDLQVRPTDIAITGFKDHVVQDTYIGLVCTVDGANPPVNVTWTNNSRIIDDREIITKDSPQSDGTYQTVSKMSFMATRSENGNIIKCEAANVVLWQDRDGALHDKVTLEVFYPPVVHVTPDNVTVHEGEQILLNCKYESNPATLTKISWYQDTIELDLNLPRYAGVNTEQQTLAIKNSTRDDRGSYTCALSNSIGEGAANNSIEVDVLFKPIVSLEMDPSNPVIENANKTVSLHCNVDSGNPDVLTAVRWYFGGELLRKLPQCMNDTNYDEDDYQDDDNDMLCGPDPAYLHLKSVNRIFKGNYSCQGFNTAGWGDISNETELVVYYEPGPATIIRMTEPVIKGRSVTFGCSVKDKGFPETERFHWRRGNQEVPDVVMSSWTIDPITLDTRSNFSCFGYNLGGNGTVDSLYLDVQVQPGFIPKMSHASKFLNNAEQVNLTCNIECVPSCELYWYKNDVSLETNDLYSIVTTNLSADYTEGYFEGISSTLIFNISSWPNNQLDKEKDNANYSCVSSANSVGPSVKSTTYLMVEYPPENINVSHAEISVVEDHIPQKVVCYASGSPVPTFRWLHNNSEVAIGQSLVLGKPVSQKGGGLFTCEARNKHGHVKMDINMNVLYKPTCDITKLEVDDEPALMCTASANPDIVSFYWEIKTNNETETEEVFNIKNEGLNSYLFLDSSVDAFRTYVCVVNNSVGVGAACERDVLVNMDRVRGGGNKDTLIILVASVIAVILVVLIICCIIIIICRRKRQNDKYHSTLNYEDRQSPEGLSSTTTPRSIPFIPPGSPAYYSTTSNHMSQSYTSQNRTGTTIETNLSPTSVRSVNETNPDIKCKPNSETNTEMMSPNLKTETLETTTLSPIANTKLSVPIPASPPRWPLRPGVLVHINTAHSLCASRKSNTTAEGSDLKNAEAPTSDATTEQITTENENEQMSKINDLEASSKYGNTIDTYNRSTILLNRKRNNLLEPILNLFRFRQNAIRKPKNGKSNRRAVSLINIAKGNPGSDAAARIRNLFGNRQDLPGIVRRDSEVVSFKKIDKTNEEDQSISRKRKKPGQDPNKTSGAPQPPESEEPPGVYENLPFHGLQSAPNKQGRQNVNVLRVAPTPKSNQRSTQNHLQTDIPTPSANNSNIITTQSYSYTQSAVPHTPINQKHQIYKTQYEPVYKNQSTSLITHPQQYQPPNVFGLFRPNPFIARSQSVKSQNVIYTPKPSLTHEPYNNNTNPFVINNQNNNDRKFNSLKSRANKKSQNFYSMRVKCKKHNSLNFNYNFSNKYRQSIKKDTYGNPNRIINSSSGSASIAANEPNFCLTYPDEHIYENLTDSIQIYESSNHSENNIVQNDGKYISNVYGKLYNSGTAPVPAPRKKKIVKSHEDDPDHLYMNLPSPLSDNSCRILEYPNESHNKIANACGNQIKTNFENHHHVTPNDMYVQRVVQTTPYYPVNASAVSSTPTNRNYMQKRNTNTNGINDCVIENRSNLTPKTLFPNTSKTHHESYEQYYPTISPKQKTKRHIKTPLQKHHSFHYQPSVTSHQKHRTNSYINKNVGKCENLNNVYNEMKLSENKCDSNIRKYSSVTNINKQVGPLIFKPFSEQIKSRPNETGFQKTEALLKNDDYFQNFLKLRKISQTSMKLYNQPVQSNSQAKKGLVYADLVDLEPRNMKDPLKGYRRPTQYATLKFNEVNV